VNRPVRVVYLSHAYMVGGAEEMVYNLVRYLPKRFEPHVCCIHSPGPIGEEIRRRGVPFADLRLNPGVRRPWDVLRIQHYLRSVAPTIVHTFLLTASLYGRLSALLARVPIVIGTEVNIYERKRRHHALAERLLMKRTDVVVASAESVRDFYIDQVHADPSRVEVIYNAVDWRQLEVSIDRAAMRAMFGIPSDAPLGGIIARLTEQKAHSVLFEAMAQTPALSSLHVLVVGDGELKQQLQARAEQLGISQRVAFAGARRDLGNLLHAVDFFVMPSLWEGLPLSMVLAMGAGLPVVATRVAGIPEVVQHERTGLLVDPGDAAQLGAAMARLVSDPEFASRLGSAARAFVTPRFGVDGYVAAVTGLYDRLLIEKKIA
jgi:glycosyltransferase involved in cell wall biosynthesis